MMTLGAAIAILLWLLIYCLVFGGALYLLRVFGSELPVPWQTFIRIVILVLGLLVLVYAVLQIVGVPQLPRLR